MADSEVDKLAQILRDAHIVQSLRDNPLHGAPDFVEINRLGVPSGGWRGYARMLLAIGFVAPDPAKARSAITQIANQIRLSREQTK